MSTMKTALRTELERSGKSIIIENKVVPVCCTCVEIGKERCHVHLMDLYLQKLPNNALELDTFYRRPLCAAPSDPQRPWFANCPVGRNTLASVVKDLCAEVGIAGRKTNHSLRATGATELFQAHVPAHRTSFRGGLASL